MIMLMRRLGKFGTPYTPPCPADVFWEAGGDDEDKAGDCYDGEDGDEDGGEDDGGGHTEDDHAVAEPGERLTNRLALQTCSDEGGE